MKTSKQTGHLIQGLCQKNWISEDIVKVLQYCEASTGYQGAFKEYLVSLTQEELKGFLEYEEDDELCNHIIWEMRKRAQTQPQEIVEYYKKLKGRNCQSGVLDWLGDALGKMNLMEICHFINLPMSGHPFFIKKTIGNALLIKLNAEK